MFGNLVILSSISGKLDKFCEWSFSAQNSIPYKQVKKLLSIHLYFKESVLTITSLGSWGVKALKLYLCHNCLRLRVFLKTTSWESEVSIYIAIYVILCCNTMIIIFTPLTLRLKDLMVKSEHVECCQIWFVTRPFSKCCIFVQK